MAHLQMEDSDKALELRVHQLFEKNKISSIQEIERATQKEIREKKQELRRLVGNRYRDLIDSADSIIAMRKSSAEIFEHLSRIEEHCHEVQSLIRKPLPRDAPQEEQSTADNAELVQKLKELVDTPEGIWVALENADHQRATDLYLHARTVNDDLQARPDAREVLRSIPLLARQWATVSRFPAQILAESMAQLGRIGLPARAYAKALYACVLLDNCGDVLRLFLDRRMSAVESLISSLGREEGAKPSQVVALVSALQQVVRDSAAIFVAERHAGEVKEGEEEGTNWEGDFLMDKAPSSAKEEEGSLLEPMLVNLLGNRPSYKATALFPLSRVREELTAWLHSFQSKVLVREGEQQQQPLLRGFTSVKSLLAAESEVWALVHQPSAAWEEQCKVVMDRKLDIWEQIFQKAFFQQAKAIVAKQFSALDISTVLEQSIAKEVTIDISAFIWSCEGDTESVEVTKNKANAVTSPTRLVVDALDEQLRGIMADIELLYDVEEEAAARGTGTPLRYSSPRKGNQISSKRRDVASLREIVQGQCYREMDSLVRNLGSRIGALFSSAEEAPSGAEGLQRSDAVQSAIFLGRLSRALICTSTQLTKILAPAASSSARLTLTRLSGLLPMRQQGKQNPHRERLELQGSLQYNIAHVMWAHRTATALVAYLEAALKADNFSDPSVRRRVWDEHVVTVDDSEGGDSTKETMLLPFQASTYVTRMLFDACTELNRVGAHTIQELVVRYLAQLLTLGILQLYDSFVTDRREGDLCKEGVMQLIFDLRVLFDVLSARYSSPDAWPEALQTAVTTARDTNSALLNGVTFVPNQAQQVKALLLKVKQQMDPIDLAFYEPLLEKFTLKSYQRSAITFGFFTQFSNAYSHTKASTSLQERHNVVTLVAPVARFPLLPTSSRSSILTSPARR